MGYELTIRLKGGWVEVEADSPAQLERRVAALDLRRLEAAIARARAAKPRAKGRNAKASRTRRA